MLKALWTMLFATMSMIASLKMAWRPRAPTQVGDVATPCRIASKTRARRKKPGEAAASLVRGVLGRLWGPWKAAELAAKGGPGPLHGVASIGRQWQPGVVGGRAPANQFAQPGTRSVAVALRTLECRSSAAMPVVCAESFVPTVAWLPVASCGTESFGPTAVAWLLSLSCGKFAHCSIGRRFGCCRHWDPV